MDEVAHRNMAANKRVLVVDDDEGLRNLIARRLRKAGFEVSLAVNGAAAVELALVDPGQLLVLDQKLVDMTGREVIRQLTDQGCKVHFVMMTGQGDERLAVEMMKLGAADYLVKGLDLLDLLPATLDRVFRAIETENRLLKAEKELQDSREQYRALIEQAYEAVVLIDPETWLIIEANQRFSV